MGLTEEETKALHECLMWGRQPGNNRVLEFYGTLYESFQQACKEMMGEFSARWRALRPSSQCVASRRSP